MQSDVQEVGFVPGSGDSGQGPDLGVPEFTLGEGIGEQRQLCQCTGDAHFLPSGMGVDAAGPAQPVGAGHRALSGPDLAAVELGDEGEKAVRRSMDVGGESGDGGGKRVVVHGGEIVGEDRMRSRH